MAIYTQTNRRIKVKTSLGPDVLLLGGFKGVEGINELFHFQLQLAAARETPIAFDKILGQPVTIELDLPGGLVRYFNGIVRRFGQGAHDDAFLFLHAEIVPRFWLWTLNVQSRIFQQQSVPQILEQVLSDLRPHVHYQFTGTYHPRDYCVQYRESDFAFACRLMEEEGIAYHFQHTADSHVLVLTDAPRSWPELPAGGTVPIDPDKSGWRDFTRIFSWEKNQELRAGRYTLRDYCFELSDQSLQASADMIDSVRAGTVAHTLTVPAAGHREIYDPHEGRSKWFDGVDPGGKDRAADLQGIFEDNQHVARVRVQEQTAHCLVVDGTSDCGQFLPGHHFTLRKHYDGDGMYLLTHVEHETTVSFNFRPSAQADPIQYQNRFACVPLSLPYRPARVTPKPILAGTQPAVVVGPPGAEIFVDKYGRVKVQFYWDRAGKDDADSSCWVRVAQIWAGNNWGAFFWPRVGHEVVVAFEEGDPDRPIVVGSVYNSKNLPPVALPAEATAGGIKSCIFHGNPAVNFNALVFHDTPGQEYVQVHSETHAVNNSETNHFHFVPRGQFTFHGSI